jgi:hypothetical protein
MSGQCGLCLSCGAPFLPMGEDMVEYDKMGNISVLYFQKLVRTSEQLQKTVHKPTFCAKPQESHLLHKTHHKHAVEYAMGKAREKQHVLDGPDRDNPGFPFMRSPTGKNGKAMFATWLPPGVEDVLDFKLLADFILSLSTDGGLTDDYENKPRCCHDCNMTMTMRFWFDYHLTGGAAGNESKIIPDGSMEVYRANTNGNNNNVIEKHDQWELRGFEDSYPQPRMSREKQVTGAALGFYLDYSCRPLATPGLIDFASATYDKQDHYALYLHMCWVVLEVTCLICEYSRGSGDAEDSNQTIKRNQCLKTPLGAAELYFSYFCWRIVCFTHAEVRTLSFQSWHQFYMWYASDCEALFPREDSLWSSKLMADRIMPDDTRISSRKLVEIVSRNMTRVLKEHIMKLGKHLSSRTTRSVKLQRYFVPRDYIQDLTTLMNRRGVYAFACARAYDD